MKYTPWDTFRTSRFPHINKVRMVLCSFSVQCWRLMLVRWQCRPNCFPTIVLSVKVGKEHVEFFHYGEVAVYRLVIVHIEVCGSLYALPLMSWVIVIKTVFNSEFLVEFCCFYASFSDYPDLIQGFWLGNTHISLTLYCSRSIKYTPLCVHTTVL